MKHNKLQTAAAHYGLRSISIPDPAFTTLCYPIMLPGRKSGFRAGCWSDANQTSFKICLLAGLRPAEGLVLRLPLFDSHQNPARKHDFQPGSAIAQHKVKYDRTDKGGGFWFKLWV